MPHPSTACSPRVDQARWCGPTARPGVRFPCGSTCGGDGGRVRVLGNVLTSRDLPRARALRARGGEAKIRLPPDYSHALQRGCFRATTVTYCLKTGTYWHMTVTG